MKILLIYASWFSYETEYWIWNYPRECEPLSGRQCICRKGAIGWREQLYAVGKGFIPEFHEAQWQFVPECKVLQNAGH